MAAVAALAFLLLLPLVLADGSVEAKDEKSSESSKSSPSEETTNKLKTIVGFPSLKSLLDTDTFLLKTPQGDLSPTDLASNAPMNFSLPQIVYNLTETELSRTSPSEYTINHPVFDLNPSFLSSDDDSEDDKTAATDSGKQYSTGAKSEENEEDQAAASDNVDIDATDNAPKDAGEKVEFDENGKLPLEPSVYKKVSKRHGSRILQVLL